MDAIRESIGDLYEDLDTILLFDPTSNVYNAAIDACESTDIGVIVVADENDVEAEQFVELPLTFPDLRDRFRFAIEAAMENDLLEDGDVTLCSTTLFGDTVDTLTRVIASEDLHTGLYDLFMNSRADPGIIRDVLMVAIDLGNKGQKGKPIGALFAVGDAGTTMNKSRPLSYNPFEKSHVHVGDPIVKTMLKEFSKLDGAFIISDAGKIVSAYRYLEPSADGVDIPKGLGARHMAGAGISKSTNATSIVLSESDGMVRAFKDGNLILELDPEDF